MERRSGFDEAMSTLGTLVFGALIGVVAGLLLAPKPGVELRKDLAEEATRVGERLSETSHEITDTVKTKVSQFAAQAEDAAEEDAATADEASDPA